MTASFQRNLTRPLLQWWHKNGRQDLPWQESPSIYKTWVSEIMLQQTQVVTVIPYFKKFIKAFPSVISLADATEDHQFIHVDSEKATPIFGSTIVHGFLSLSLTAGIGGDIALVVEGAKMGLNYGLDKVRFLSPVPVDSRIRMNSVVMDITEKNPGQFLVKSSVTMEIEGVEKPAFVAETLSMWVT